MTEIAESVSPDLIAEINHDESCYFCNSKNQPVNETNTSADDPDDDSAYPGLEEDGIRFKNNASALGSALGGAPGKKDVKVSAQSLASSTAAHHLIPGNAALKNSKFFLEKKYVWTDGSAQGNIGYNVNSGPNGVWLPGNYAQRPWGKKGAAFAAAKGVSATSYAFISINEWRSQFHDAHEDYSDLVRQALDQVFDKLQRNESIVCPEAAKKQDDDPKKKSPLYILVARFHSISGRMKKKLVFPTENWFKNVFTSAFSLEYMTALPGTGGARG